MGCCDWRWGGSSCSWCFSIAYGYRKGEQMWVNGSTDLEGVHGAVNGFELEWARLADGSPRSQPVDGVLWREMRWPHVFIVFFSLWTMRLTFPGWGIEMRADVFGQQGVHAIIDHTNQAARSLKSQRWNWCCWEFFAIMCHFYQLLFAVKQTWSFICPCNKIQGCDRTWDSGPGCQKTIA